MISAGAPVCRLRDVAHAYGGVGALQSASFDVQQGMLYGLIGPDGAGKSTLLGLIAGARRMQTGEIQVLGGDMRDPRHRGAVASRIAYLPQGLGSNLFPELSVRENLAFFARLFGLGRSRRDNRIAMLLEATGLASFSGRAVRKLSGGMRQKLGLCCALLHDPDLLILDEPTTGVDPLSRRQFWSLLGDIRRARPHLSVLVATAYMEEASGCDVVMAVNEGRIIAAGRPADLQAETGAATIEEMFTRLVTPGPRGPRGPSRSLPPGGEPVIVARGLTRRFGAFTAVDHVQFTIARGEIFGFVGSNGCGKTTTMKMLTGLLPASAGEALVLGKPARSADVDARRRVGYMSQSFSLYTELTVRQNLELHARLFGLHRDHARRRITDLLAECELGAYEHQSAADIPLGIRQRLSLAVAIVHEPELLILDEPTSGVDPGARDRFWDLLFALSRQKGVTIFVSTHFMTEAERCDRIALMDAGRVIAVDTPGGLAAARGVATLEDAFISYLEEAKGDGGRPAAALAYETASPPPLPGGWFNFQRCAAYAIREAIDLLRDPVRMAFAFLGSAFLLLIFGFGISMDVNAISFAVLDRDQSVESRAYLGEMRGSRYFVEKPPLADYAALQQRMRNGDINLAIEIPPHFGRDLKRGSTPEVGAWIDGATPMRAQTVRGYVEGLHQFYLNDRALNLPAAAAPAADIAVRYRYNQHFDSAMAMVPSSISLLLVMIPSILMAVAIVREKELGSITNLYVTPVRRLEFLLGKQAPYVAISLMNFLVLLLMARVIFAVPLKGSFSCLLVAAAIYVMATTGIGMLVSSFTSSQTAAIVGTSIGTTVPAVQFSGMLTPVSSLTGAAALMGKAFPMTYFLRVCIGVFTKGLGWSDLAGNVGMLALFVPVLTLISVACLRKQQA